MGRKGYLTRLALGRSAFEAPEISSQNAPGPSERKVDASNQAEPAGVSGLAPSGPYVQLYDERGHPINPTSRALGRRIRQAQNDVLAAIGVVERTTLRLGDEHALSDDNAILENLQDEVLIGNICSFESSLTNWLSTLWIDSIRKQLMVVPSLSEVSMSRIISAQFSYPGYTRFILTGALNFGLSELIAGAVLHLIPWSRVVDQVVIWLRLPRKARKLIQRFKPYMKEASYFLISSLLSPFIYYSVLQTAQIRGVASMLPPLKSFWPSSSSSPIYRPSPIRDLSLAGVASALILYPPVIIRLHDYFYDKMETYYYELLDRVILQPRNPDKFSSFREKHRYGQPQQTILGSVFSAIGWGHRHQSLSDSQLTVQSLPTSNTIQDVEDPADDLALSNPVIVTNRPEDLEENSGSTQDNLPATSQIFVSEPSSPIERRHNIGEAEPTIFIRSRDESANGMEVEMEIVLPQNNRQAAGQENPQPPSTRRVHKRQRVESMHRVTELSVAPANILATLVSRQIAVWITLPLDALMTRTIVADYLQRSNQDSFTNAAQYVRIWSMVGSPAAWTSINQVPNAWQLLNKFALCSMMELAVGLGLWHFHSFGAWYTGRTAFNWGRL